MSIISIGLIIVISLAFIAMIIMAVRERQYTATVFWSICIILLFVFNEYTLWIVGISSLILLIFFCATPKHK